ncbi:DDT domain-containing protein DDB_G0282237 [Selaginella moellendorffii]|uniref:DDT domain-containing protein DDB_G0282237 n=1 Tax=Selaginella moellendorffii TaxID=88036 RepID=UPI000D1D002C|nr:DDT domain-containing protein DDB_G0282237 [Selaginella moellendorffii]|eukprot:XP_024534608.1 DDT domain-containing protein DDB_G0282237 [Selaginella moellendorffii]
MPLYKRSAFPLAEVPADISPNEEVFQVRFTKEIFRDYQEYLNRMKLYRQKVWTCKVTGKTNLDYEQALSSESKASELVQNFPKEFIGPVLRMVQFSPSCVSDLVDRIHKRFKDHFVEGEVLDGVCDGSVRTCKILRVLEENQECEPDNCSCSYEVAFIKSDGKVKCTDNINVQSLRRKKHPLTKCLLKSFIRESAFIGVSKKSRWAVHDNLARLHNVALHPTSEEESAEGSDLREMCNGGSKVRNGVKRKSSDDDSVESNGNNKRKKSTDGSKQKYPIEDKLLPPPSERPAPSSEFSVPAECVGHLLMVWDFCSAFATSLEITQFTLDDFEEALCSKEEECPLLEEVHHALLKAILSNTNLCEKLQVKRKDKKGKRKLQILPETWKDDLADVLELIGSDKTKPYASSIRLGDYSELEPLARLEILHDLTEPSASSIVVRGQLDEHIPRRKDSKKKQASPEIEDEDDDEPPVGEHLAGTNGSSKLLKSFKRKKKPVAKKKQKEDADTSKCPLRNIYLGVDRDFNRYWFFPREPRIFIENEDSTKWSFYSDKEEFDAFCSSLNLKGIREKDLKEQIDQHYGTICITFEAYQASSDSEHGSEHDSEHAEQSD